MSGIKYATTGTVEETPRISVDNAAGRADVVTITQGFFVACKRLRCRGCGRAVRYLYEPAGCALACQSCHGLVWSARRVTRSRRRRKTESVRDRAARWRMERPEYRALLDAICAKPPLPRDALYRLIEDTRLKMLEVAFDEYMHLLKRSEAQSRAPKQP